MSSVVTAPRPSSPPAWARMLAVPPAVAAVLVGIWVAGGIVTDGFLASMALTVLWFARVAGAGAYLGYTSTTDRTVDEVLVSGPAALEGSFRGLAHPTEGTAAVVEQGGELVLTLSDFRTDPGPDLFVYVVPGSSSGDRSTGVRGSGGPRGPTATSSARSAGLDLPGGASVVVWCRAFSISFGAAGLAGAA